MNIKLAEILQASSEFAERVEKDLLIRFARRKAANDNLRNSNTDAMTYPGGLAEELVDWIVSSSERPSRWLALSAALPFLGALAGRRFESITGLRTNLYVAALASSGTGKEHARSQLKRLATAASLDSVFGPSRFMSASALRNSVQKKPSSVCMVDEFDTLMTQINDPRAGIHNQLIKGDLKDMWSAASTYFEGSEYANTPALRIFNPNLCLYGTGTPGVFWKSLSSSNTSDGLLPRFILFEVDSTRPQRVKREVDVQHVPQELIAKCQSLGSSQRGVGNIAANRALDSGETRVVAHRVDLDDSASKVLEGFKSTLDEVYETTPDEERPILNRAAEHAVKLALIVAIGKNPESPTVTEADMSWATKLAWYSTNRMMNGARDLISDNVREANYKRILGLIKAEGDEGITLSRIIDRAQSIEARARTEVLSDLQTAGRIEFRTTKTKGRSSNRFFFVG